MKILFIANYVWPHVGGVEKHIREVTKCLRLNDYEVKSISEKDINYPHIKILGLLYIWFWLFKNRRKILESDIVHIHDVFIWYLPFRFLYPKKPVFTTFHGWEGKYPIPFINIFQKKIANKLSFKTISVGDYINKWYGIKSDIVIYGAVDKINTQSVFHKIPNTILYLGRLEIDTGLCEFLKWLKINKKFIVTFLGEGSLKNNCEKYGKVLSNRNPNKYLKIAEYCVPSGYLSYIEAKNYRCKIITFANNPLKEDYWNEIKIVKKFPTWEKLSDIYLKFWKI